MRGSAEDKPAKPPEGFTSIFDGKTLEGWKATGKKEMWAAEPGLIVCKGGGGGWLITEKEYGDFEFRCEYRWEKKGGNSGVGLRCPAPADVKNWDPAYHGMEIQLIDDEGWFDVPQVQVGACTAHRFHLRRATGEGSEEQADWRMEHNEDRLPGSQGDHRAE